MYFETFSDSSIGKLSYPRTWYVYIVPITKHSEGCHIISHLSAPDSLSINDFIDPLTYSLTCYLIGDTYTIIILNNLEPGALLGKIDLKDAFRLISVRPPDWNLVGIIIVETEILHQYLFTVQT